VTAALGRRRFVRGATAVVLLGALLRLLWLDRFPPGLHYDEAAYGLQAIDLLQHPRLVVFFPAFTGREPLFIYVAAVTFRLLGTSVFTLRLVAALIGVAAVAAPAVVGRALFGPGIGLLAAGLLAASFWHVVISRMAYRADLVPLVAPLAIWLLWRAWQRPSIPRGSLAGAAWGSLAYTYVSVRLLPLALVLFAVLELGAGPLRDRRRLTAALAFVAAALLVAAPLLVHFARHPEEFGTRFSQTSTIASESAGPAATSVLGGVLDTLRMYGVRGDALQKYNLPLRPALDAPQALLLAVGVVTLSWRIRESRSRLVLCWLVGALAPGFVTADSPNFLRLIGAAPPSYLAAAVGFFSLWEKVGSAQAKARPAVVALAALLVAAKAGITVRAYFGDWARSADTYYALDGDLADLGRLAAAQPPDLPLFASSEHYKHPTAAFTAGPAFDRLSWFDGRGALPLPPGPAAYLIPRSAVPRDDRLLGLLADQRFDPGGEPSVRLFRRASAAVQPIGQPVGLTFVGDDGAPLAELAGMDVSGASRAGETVGIQTTWRLLADVPPEPLDFFAHALDADGRRWGQRDASPYLTAEWRRGQSLVVWLDVPIDATAPAGQYRVRLGLDDPKSAKALATRRSDGSTGPPELVAGGFPVAHATARPVPDLLADFRRDAPGGAHIVEPSVQVQGPVTLLAAALPASIAAGQESSIDLLWVATSDVPTGTPLDASLLLRSSSGVEQNVSRRSLSALDPGIPWLAGEAQRDARRFAPTRDQVGVWDVAVRIGANEVELGKLDVTIPPSGPAVGQPRHAANAQLGNFAQLVGFDVTPTAVRLYWRALGPATENYTVFVHALDAGDHILAQNDAPPAAGARPTRGWAPGETIADDHPLAVPPGATMLAVGLYDPRTGERVALSTGGDRVLLPLPAGGPA
jgi:4-amino-4-deoxy-L-arabinose transferase-like glycosyltransferase